MKKRRVLVIVLIVVTVLLGVLSIYIANQLSNVQAPTDSGADNNCSTYGQEYCSSDGTKYRCSGPITGPFTWQSVGTCTPDVGTGPVCTLLDEKCVNGVKYKCIEANGSENWSSIGTCSSGGSGDDDDDSSGGGDNQVCTPGAERCHESGKIVRCLSDGSGEVFTSTSCGSGGSNDNDDDTDSGSDDDDNDNDSGSSNPPPSTPTFELRVTNPDPSSQLEIGQRVSIRWRATNNNGTYDIRLSRNGGQTFTNIFNDVQGTDTYSTGLPAGGTFSWTVTGPVTSNALIRVIRSDGTNDIMDGSFSIIASTSTTPPPTPPTPPVAPSGGSGSTITCYSCTAQLDDGATCESFTAQGTTCPANSSPLANGCSAASNGCAGETGVDSDTGLPNTAIISDNGDRVMIGMLIILFGIILYKTNFINNAVVSSLNYFFNPELKAKRLQRKQEGVVQKKKQKLTKERESFEDRFTK